MNRISLDPAQLDAHSVYKLLTGLVVPRAIAWVSTLSADGVPNLAPFSYFTIASSYPPMLLFCPNRHPDGAKKDTLRNIEGRPEFVIHIVSESLVAAMNTTAGLYPPDVDEFTLAELETLPSLHVQPKRIAAAPAAFECTLEQIVPVGSGEIVIGRVVALHLQPEIYDSGYIKIDALKPVGRLAGNEYVRCQDRFRITRPD